MSTSLSRGVRRSWSSGAPRPRGIGRLLCSPDSSGIGPEVLNGLPGGPSTPGADTAPAPLASPFQSSRPSPLSRGAPIDHERLTPRESEVLTYLSKGFTIKEIANLMGIKWFTVNDHIKSIYKKLNVSSRAEAAVLASKQGLV